MAVFLMENGVLSLGNKTPVTILQETLHRKGLNPHYELIYNGTGTVDPVFKYQVSALGYTAIGDGKSKKEAKHDAAAALLRRMQVSTESSNTQGLTDIASPYAGALKQNFVGMLDEICVNNKIPFPVYVPITEDGPPHARIFTMQCKLSTCTETVVARTKKQGKHMAAQQMINRITNIMGDMFIPITEKTIEDLSLIDSHLKAIENGNYRHDLSIPVADFHNVFHHKMEEFLVPKSFIDLSLESEIFYESLENPKEVLDEIVLGLEGLTKTIPISKEVLIETFQEIEKDCLTSECLQKEELDSSTDEQTSLSDVDDNHFDNVTNLLEEFVLEEDLEQSPKMCSEWPECSDKILENTSLELLDHSEEVSALLRPVFLFLVIECPQGKWSFRGIGETVPEAEKNAAVQALKFLRTMSISSNIKQSDSES